MKVVPSDCTMKDNVILNSLPIFTDMKLQTDFMAQ